MTTQYTPGPWRVGDAGHTVFGPPNGNPSPESIALVRSKDNARLIAAAPEMLEALTAILAGFRSGELNVTKKRWEDSDPYNPALAEAQAAINKATGEPDR